MIGNLECSGNGTPILDNKAKAVGVLQVSCLASNSKLLRQLKEQEHSRELLRASQRDAELGRMTFPTRVEECNLDEVLLHPRFGVAQSKPDGRLKLRAVDLGPRRVVGNPTALMGTFAPARNSAMTHWTN